MFHFTARPLLEFPAEEKADYWFWVWAHLAIFFGALGPAHAPFFAHPSASVNGRQGRCVNGRATQIFPQPT